MVKILNSSSRSFDRELEKLLTIRKNKVQSSSVSVTNIIKDVKKFHSQTESPKFNYKIPCSKVTMR